MRWYAKCLIDSAKAVIPFHDQVRRLKHRVSGYPMVESNDQETMEHGLQLVDSIRPYHAIEGSTFLEVGTGWKPNIPIIYSLAGAKKVLLTDLRPLCSGPTLAATVETMRRRRQLLLDRLPITAAQLDSALRWDPSWTFADGLRHFRLEYLAPCDCQKLNLPDGSVDLVTSRAVLEHIPPPVVQGIFNESFRILAPDGYCCHIVDNSDHWEHGDKSLSRVNFLRYSDPVFRWTYVNGLNYQNRLRHSEYISFLKAAGFSIIREEGIPDPRSLADLRQIPLAEPFRRFTPEDLAVLHTFVLASKTPRSQ